MTEKRDVEVYGILVLLRFIKNSANVSFILIKLLKSTSSDPGLCPTGNNSFIRIIAKHTQILSLKMNPERLLDFPSITAMIHTASPKKHQTKYISYYRVWCPKESQIKHKAILNWIHKEVRVETEKKMCITWKGILKYLHCPSNKKKTINPTFRRSISSSVRHTNVQLFFKLLPT